MLLRRSKALTMVRYRRSDSNIGDDEYPDPDPALGGNLVEDVSRELGSNGVVWYQRVSDYSRG